jgi:hypothetical protein
MSTHSRRLQRRLSIAAGIAIVSVVAAAVVGPAQAKPAPGSSQRRIHIGEFGSPHRFASLVGERGDVQQVYVNFKKGPKLRRIIGRLRSVPMVSLIPGTVGRETATPEGIAEGENDRFLFQLNAAIAAHHGPLFYVRPFPEMNGHWESNCAFNRDGTARPDYDSTAWSRKAFARIAIIARGGTAAAINRQLARLHLPAIRHGLPDTTSKVRMVWNPQGFGAPLVPGNAPNDYYPGDAYVDVVADDIYATTRGATWWAAEALYASHPTKAFGFGEWGLWGLDHPTFVHKMAIFAATHHRVVLLAFFNGRPRSKFDLGAKPESAAAYRKYIEPLGHVRS